MKLHATVRLREDLPEHRLARGAIGAVVAILESPSLAYEVEFADQAGRTLAQVALPPHLLEEVAG